jgi:hypothetical protein
LFFYIVGIKNKGDINKAKRIKTMRYKRCKPFLGLILILLFPILGNAEEPKVISPLSGVTWVMGETYTIEWSGFSGSTVDVLLYRGEAIQLELNDVSNKGSLSFEVPIYSDGTDYQIIIWSKDRKQHASSGDFTITKPVEEGSQIVLTPEENEQWIIHKEYKVTWSGFSGSAVDIILYKGSLQQLTRKDVPNTGSYWFTVPSLMDGSDYRFIIIAGDQHAGSKYFSIVRRPVVAQPHKDDVLSTGSLCMIVWDGFSTGSNVEGMSVELFQNQKKIMTITSTTDTVGHHNWRVPSDLSGSGYQIRVSSNFNDEEAVSDEFEIRVKLTVTPAVPVIEQHKPTLRVLPTITSPKANAKWKAGNKYEIKWVGIKGERVRIELFQGPVRRLVIAKSAVNKGFYKWNIPVSFKGPNYRIVISPAVYTKTPAQINSPTFSIY